MTYFKSDLVRSGQRVGTGTLIATFRVSPGASQTPLLHCVLSFLLSKQALSMYIITLGCFRLTPMVYGQVAG